MGNIEIPEEFKLLDEWQNILGLNDWYIILKTHCSPDDLTIEDASGEVQYEESTKSAEIRILDLKHAENCFRPFDFESTLVHELLHLKMCLLAEGDDWFVSTKLRTLHQIIDDLARAFISVKNRDQKNESIDPRKADKKGSKTE